ncbi:hypothetical protein L7F22_027939 [Adiantum nelumboides]|nr:hypothetical protein [Adiantum nelumboides]
MEASKPQKGHEGSSQVVGDKKRKSRSRRHIGVEDFPLGVGSTPYDLISDVSKQGPKISWQQLLHLSPQMRRTWFKMVSTRRAKAKVVGSISARGMKDIVPVIDAKIKSQWISNVYVDGGVEICVMTKKLMHMLGLEVNEQTFLQAKMANNVQVACVGKVNGMKVSAFGIVVSIDAYVIPTKGEDYPLILGRPWLMAMKARQDWETTSLELRPSQMVGGKQKKIVYDMKQDRQQDLDMETFVDEWSTSSCSSSEEDARSLENNHCMLAPTRRCFPQGRMTRLPGMQPTLEAESDVGDEVHGVVEDILMAKDFAVKSPRQQLTPRRLLHSLLSAKASPSVDTRDEALDEAVADANPRGGATASRGLHAKIDTVDDCTPTSITEFVPNVPNAIDVLVVYDDVHTDVDFAKLEKGTLPIPTTVESGRDAIVDAMVVDAMVVDACTYAIADATIVDACTNDIVDAMEVDASTDAAADGNVNDGGIESIVHAFVDAILDAVEAMDAIVDATVVDACTNDIVNAMEVDASTNAIADVNVNDAIIESIVCAIIDAILDAVEAMGTDATVEDTRGMGEEVLIEREAGTREAVGASDAIAQAEVACPSDATDGIVDAKEAKGYRCRY